jgi:iron(III) transport system substrate-binding protein
MRLRDLRWFAILPAVLIALVALAACGGDDDDDPTPAPTTPAATATPTTATATVTAATPTATPRPSGRITVYSGRSESLVGPMIAEFTKATGIQVDVKYAGTSALATLLLEEGNASPADVFFAQDGGSLGAVSAMLDPLPEDITTKVVPAFKARNNTWVGTSARARVIAYSTKLNEADVPNSYAGLTDPKWKGKVGWAPTNASFHTFVTLLQKVKGNAAAEQWLRDMVANGVRAYPGNREIVSAIAAGEIELGLVNHYYLWGFIKDQGESFPVRNHYTAPGDPATFVNIAGAGVLKTSKNKPAALEFVRYMLSDAGQKYFSDQTFEYPVVPGLPADPRLKPLTEIRPPDIDLSDLADLKGTLDLLRKVGIIQ